jgi:adenylate kinase
MLLGAPGSGKGTQAAMISGRYGIPHISTGDILRQAVTDGTGLGLKAKGYMDRGELVPDEIIIGVVEECLQEKDCERGFILDGFPRTIAQAESLEKSLKGMGRSLNVVLNIEVEDEEIIRRLTGRRICERCGRIFHLLFDPSKKRGVCEVCGGDLYQRVDDTEETVRRRLEVYKEQTAPLIDFYERRGLLRNVQGEKSAADVFEHIRGALEGIRG